MDTAPPEYNVLSLCTGGGGLELGLRLALPTARGVCYVEREAYACAVLEARMRDGLLDEAPIWTDLASFDGKPWRGVVDIVTAGWPCQPFSSMGKRKGAQDPRHLWPYVKGVVRDCQPALLFGENVLNHVDIGFDLVVSDLREMGYGCEAGIFTTAEVGGKHARARLFVLAYPEGQDARRGECEQIFRASLGGRHSGVDGQVLPAPRGDAGLSYPPGRDAFEDWGRVIADNPALKPAFLNSADELASGLGESSISDREKELATLGNGVVPVCAAYAFSVLLGRALGHLPRPAYEV